MEEYIVNLKNFTSNAFVILDEPIKSLDDLKSKIHIDYDDYEFRGMMTGNDSIVLISLGYIYVYHSLYDTILDSFINCNEYAKGNEKDAIKLLELLSRVRSDAYYNQYFKYTKDVPVLYSTNPERSKIIEKDSIWLCYGCFDESVARRLTPLEIAEKFYKLPEIEEF